jgi:hypothetical protein
VCCHTNLACACSQDAGYRYRLEDDLPNLKTDYNFDMEALHVLHKANPTLSLQPSGEPGEELNLP